MKKLLLRLEAIWYLLIGVAEPEDTRLGHNIRMTAGKLEAELEKQPNLLLHLAFFFCNEAGKSNVGKLEMIMKEIEYKGEFIGDWKITVERIEEDE